MDYRSRCYSEYVSGHFAFFHDFSITNYERMSRLYKRRYGRFLPPDKSISVCDIACGAGYFLYFLRKEGYSNVVGIDISPEQVELCRRLNLPVEHGDALKYLVDKVNSFDLITAFDIIEHFTKEEVFCFLDLVYRALKPGGLFFLSTVNAGTLLGARYVFIDFTHEIGFTATSLLQVLRISGFREVKVFGEKPVIHDCRSAIRALFWAAICGVLNIYRLIESGAGRYGGRGYDVFEPRMFSVARK